MLLGAAVGIVPVIDKYVIALTVNERVDEILVYRFKMLILKHYYFRLISRIWQVNFRSYE